MNESTFYMVNRKTREHKFMVVIHQPIAERRPEWYRVEADADGWIEWDYKDADGPLPFGAEYEVKHADGDVVSSEDAETFDDQWDKKGLSSDIVAYRPIFKQPASEEPKGWDGEGLPPIGEKVEIFTERREWEKGTVIMHHDSRVLVYLDSAANWRYESGTPAKIRRLPTPRERWVDKAALAMGAKRPQNANHLGLIYDALASGELEAPTRN